MYICLNTLLPTTEPCPWHSRDKVVENYVFMQMHAYRAPITYLRRLAGLADAVHMLQKR